LKTANASGSSNNLKKMMSDGASLNNEDMMIPELNLSN